MVESLRILLDRIVDYAGLFPPAELDLEAAVQNYANYLQSDERPMLGRFILPITQLDDFERITREHFPDARHPENRHVWRLSVLGSGNIDADLESIANFNERYGNSLRDIKAKVARIDALEIKIADSEEAGSVLERERVANRADLISIMLFCEVPFLEDQSEFDKLLVALGIAQVWAKVRTGGLSAEAFPSARQLAHFLWQWRRVGDLGFKATAGLHHPLRATHNLTYKSDSPRAMMHGFLNVFLAYAFIHNGMAEDEAVLILHETSADAFRFEADGVHWRGHYLNNDDLQRSRAFALSFGSCSFTEPVQDLKTLNLL